MANSSIPTPKSNMPPLSLLVAVFVGSMIITGVVLYLVLDSMIEDPVQPTALEIAQVVTDGVRTINPAREVMDFTFTSHTGDPLSLSDLRGKPVLLYFGYTGCPDVCPMTIFDMDEARALLGADGDKVAYLFVSVDPVRDQPERLARYFETRSVADYMLGMVGEAATLRQISPDYGLFFEAQAPQENGYYTVDHTASLFLLDAQGRLSHIFAFGTEPEVIAETLREQL
ncbi:MAG: hypothetical protein OHK0046_25260 [Anaerolineae bacterium]